MVGKQLLLHMVQLSIDAHVIFTTCCNINTDMIVGCSISNSIIPCVL